MPRITINGKVCDATAGQTVLEAARAVGITIPTLCHDERLAPSASCRMCLVQIEGARQPLTACNTPVSDGMVIDTCPADLEDERRALLDWLAHHYPADAVDRFPAKPLHRLLREYGITARTAPDTARHDDSHPLIAVDMQRCVLCYRCVQICDTLQGQLVWHAVGRGDETHIVPGRAPSLRDSDCVACGACVDTCPSGALEDRAVIEHGVPERWTRTTCPYCGTGCEIELGTRDGRVIVARPAPDAAVNKGHLCVKGRYAVEFGATTDRVTTPLLRVDGSWREASWDQAIHFIVTRLRALRERHGADSVAILGSARATNEDNYIIQKFARLALGTHNVDCCARVCHTPTAAAMKLMLGAGAATNSYDDIELARLILVCGCNPTENHPVLGARIKQAARRGAQLIVIDPRRIELAEAATVHVALRPGGNIPLLNALAHVIVTEQLYDAGFVTTRVDEFEQFCAYIAEWTPERAAPLCGVEPAQIRDVARRYATAGPALMVHGLGITEHVQGTEGVMALVNLALLTGNLGKPGSGINPLRGQNNVQGAAHMGCDPGTLTGGVALHEGSSRFESAWGASLPTSPGLNLMQMIDAAGRGELKALWSVGYDILLTNANATVTRQALAQLELLVVQDLYLNETARELAHVLLPAASGFEKDGTYMNAERRIQRVRQALAAPGQARGDWQILCDVARALGYQEQFGFASAQAVWDEVRSVWPAGAGISYARLEQGGLQWPCPDESHPGTPLLHRHGFAQGPRAALRRIAYHPTPEQVSAEYPLLLITGRTLHAFNAGTMTGRSQVHTLRPTDTVDVCADDAHRQHLTDGQWVQVISRYGSATLPLRISATVKPGELFATFHDPRVFLNHVTSPHRDRMVKTPEYKCTAVRLEPV
ncbi:MAG: formate dehydrogenase subunit alpha [Gammaproteobacteria bacterium]|nr:formate dehydrogenase subunit alpha [Gammaproteobacteria bacterium]